MIKAENLNDVLKDIKTPSKEVKLPMNVYTVLKEYADLEGMDLETFAALKLTERLAEMNKDLFESLKEDWEKIHETKLDGSKPDDYKKQIYDLRQCLTFVNQMDQFLEFTYKESVE